MFSALLKGLSGHLPSQCAVCRAWPARPVCESCVERFAQPRLRCPSCALPIVSGITQCGACIRSAPPLDACLAALAYQYPWSRLIVEFKYGARAAWASTFATLLRSTPWVEPALDSAQLVLPMPLSPQRLRQRGFNQALVLARQLASAKTDAGLLLRIRDTAPQTLLKRRQRQHNVRHAFAVDPERAGELAHARVVLVDDVMTSGASLHAAAAALRAAGAAHITAVVLARADPPPDGSA